MNGVFKNNVDKSPVSSVNWERCQADAEMADAEMADATNAQDGCIWNRTDSGK